MADTPIREAARRMAEARASSAVVRLPSGELGILTDGDLRIRVVAGACRSMRRSARR